MFIMIVIFVSVFDSELFWPGYGVCIWLKYWSNKKHHSFVHVCVCVLELLQIAGISHGSTLGPSAHQQHPGGGEATGRRPSDILDATMHELKLEKSNILMLGPTGSGTNLSLLNEFIIIILYIFLSQ